MRSKTEKEEIKQKTELLYYPKIYMLFDMLKYECFFLKQSLIPVKIPCTAAAPNFEL